MWKTSRLSRSISSSWRTRSSAISTSRRLEGLTALDDLPPRLVAHALDELEHPRIGGGLVSVQGHELRHVDALVAHPLDVLDHVQQRRDHAQVAGHRSLEGEQRQDSLVNLEVAAVDAVVVRDDHARELDVLVLDGLERSIERRCHELQASERGSLQARELLLEVGSGGVRQPASRPSPSRTPRSGDPWGW